MITINGAQSPVGLSPNNTKKKLTAMSLMKPSDLNCVLQLASILQAKELRIAEKHEIPY